MFRLSRLLLVFPFSFAASASAAVFDVDTTVDAVDAVIDGVCGDTSGRCTLRAAVQEANADAGSVDEINVPAGTYTLKRTGAFEDAAASGDLDLLGPVTIRGAGAGATIVKGKKDRVFDVYASEVLLIDLTVTKGKAPKADDSDEEAGGGIRNVGSLELENIVVTRNKASNDSGGIANHDGTLVLRDVTVSRNSAKDDAGGLDNDGGTVVFDAVTFSKNKAKDEAGAFESEDGGSLVGENVTVSGNRAREAGGINASQGGIIELASATITGNRAKEGGGVQVEDDTSGIHLKNTIVARNKKTNCAGLVISAGGNVEDGASCGFATPGDRPNVANAGLDKKLRDNGGSTQTHALLPGSPAIDFAVDAECPPADQRGQVRYDDPAVDGSVCDSGAFELVPAN